MDWKMQYYQHVNLPQIDVQSQHNPNQIPAGFLDRCWQADSKMYMKRQKRLWGRERGDYEVRVRGDFGGGEAVLYHAVVTDTRFYASVKMRITSKCCEIDCGDGGAYSVNISKSTESYTLNGSTVWYMNYISTKLLPKKNFKKTQKTKKK